MHETIPPAAEENAKPQWNKRLPGLPRVRVRRDPTSDPSALHLIDSGHDVLTYAAGSHAAEVMTPEVADVEEADLVGGFVQDVQDWGDLFAELDMPDRLRAELAVTGQLKELRQAGFVVYCGQREDTIEGGAGGPSPWHVSIIGVFRIDDPRIRPDTSPSQLTAD